MSLKDEITKGIGAHGLWKQRLIDAIANGKSDWKPDTVCMDNQCDFGKWLYGASPADKKSPHYETVKSLHAQFHKVAGEILRLALSGKKSEANTAMGDNSQYRDLSSKLTKEMMAWRDHSN